MWIVFVFIGIYDSGAIITPISMNDGYKVKHFPVFWNKYPTKQRSSLSLEWTICGKRQECDKGNVSWRLGG